jgi:hypothetical protein
MRPYLKNKLKAERSWGMAQVEGCLLSKSKSLSSHLSPAKKKKKRILTKIEQGSILRLFGSFTNGLYD